MLGPRSLSVLSCIVTLSIVSKSNANQRYCAYQGSSLQANDTLANAFLHDLELPSITKSGQIVNNTIACLEGMEHCYWFTYSTPQGQQTLQGCWYPADLPNEDKKCESTICSPGNITIRNNPDHTQHFCCCHGDFCNTNNTAAYRKFEVVPTPPPKVTPMAVTKIRPMPSDQLYCAFIDIGITRDDRDGDGIPSFSFSAEYGANLSDIARSGTVLPDNKTIKCAPGSNHCFSLWMTIQGKLTILKQGCWIPSNHDCNEQRCVATSQLGDMLLEGGRFCCCKGLYCNKNITDNYDPAAVVATISKPTVGPLVYRGDTFDNYRMKIIAMAISPIVALAFIVILAFLAYRLWVSKRKETPDAIHLMESTSSPGWELDSLKLNTLINGGRYGEVWRGTLGDLDVAVKVFTGSSQRQYYVSERDVYTLPHMNIDELPRFYGAEDRVADSNGPSNGPSNGVPRHLLVMEYVTGGTLTNFLKNQTYDWVTMCKLCKSVARGLSHLHTEILKGDKFKPAIAHRDLNTRNILVRPDQTCVVCDFGFAMQIIGSNYIKNGSQEVAEQSSLNDVGTIRYMPPEVLEGAVNLRDCEASLKQIDIYALGLVYWEIGSRCTDLYQGLPVPEYQLPFQAELGLHPTFEEMTLMVSKNKARPLFPDVWKDSNQGIRALKETIEDCWDQDGEARLTSLCVEERAAEMEALWTARQRGVTPKINTTNFQSVAAPIPEKTPQLCNTNMANENQGEPNLDALRVHEQNLKNLETTSPTIQLPPPLGSHSSTPSASASSSAPQNPLPPASSSHGGRHRMFVSENSASTATTDTLLSPTEMVRPPPNVSHPATWSMYVTRNNKMPPPHQGQNPTVERNTHKSSDEDLEIQGNTLVTKGANPSSVPATKGSTSISAGASSSLDGAGFHGNQPPPYPHSPSVSDVLMGSLGGDTLETSLVQHDALNRSSHHTPAQPPVTVAMRNVPRIPYMQNDMLTEPLIVRPKQSNVCQETQKQSEPRAFFGKLFKKHKLHLPFFQKKSDASRENDGHQSSRQQQEQPLINSSARDKKNQQGFQNGDLSQPPVRQSAGTSNLEIAANQIGAGSAYQNYHHHNIAEPNRLTNLSNGLVSTEVRLDGNQAVVRPTNTPALVSSDGRGRHGNSHHGNLPLGSEDSEGNPLSRSDSTELKKRYNNTQAPLADGSVTNVAACDPKTEDNNNCNLNVVGVGDNTTHPIDNRRNVKSVSPRDGKRNTSCSSAVDLSPVMENSAHNPSPTSGSRSAEKNQEGKPRRPSSLVIKGHGLQNGGAAHEKVKAEGLGDKTVAHYYNHNHHMSSPNLCSEVSPTAVFLGQQDRGPSASGSGNRGTATSE